MPDAGGAERAGGVQQQQRRRGRVGHAPRARRAAARCGRASASNCSARARFADARPARSAVAQGGEARPHRRGSCRSARRRGRARRSASCSAAMADLQVGCGCGRRASATSCAGAAAGQRQKQREGQRARIIGRSGSRPVISGGCGRPIRSSSVGARSARRRRRAAARPAGRRRGSPAPGWWCGRCAAPPVTGSTIISQLPWSAVTIIAPPAASSAAERAAKALVHRLAGRDGGRQVAGMADHVGVGEVHHDQVVALARSPRPGGRSPRRRDISGLQVIGRDLGRGGHVAVLARVGGFLAAVQEEGDMGILLGLGQRGTGCGRGPRPIRRACCGCPAWGRRWS